MAYRPDADCETIEIRVMGKVQKIGFRNCVRRLALRLAVKGEVMNLPDGSVRILVTGEQAVLEKYLSMIYTCPRAIIRDLMVEHLSFREFFEFTIVKD